MAPREIRGQVGRFLGLREAPGCHETKPPCWERMRPVEVNWAIIVGAVGGLANLIWMLTTLRIENRIAARIDGLKEWMEDRYVSVSRCEGCHATLGVHLVEIERRVTKLETVRP